MLPIYLAVWMRCSQGIPINQTLLHIPHMFINSRGVEMTSELTSRRSEIVSSVCVCLQFGKTRTQSGQHSHMLLSPCWNNTRTLMLLQHTQKPQITAYNSTSVAHSHTEVYGKVYRGECYCAFVNQIIDSLMTLLQFCL